MSEAEKAKIGIHTGADLREKTVETFIANPALAKDLFQTADRLSFIKPDALKVGGNEYEVNAAYTLKEDGTLVFAGGHSITKKSDKGGNKTDYFKVGKTDKDGKFEAIPGYEFVSERGEGKVHSFRIITDGKGIASAMIAIDKAGNEVKGYFVENKDKAAPAGEYGLILSKMRNLSKGQIESLKYGENYVFFKDGWSSASRA